MSNPFANLSDEKLMGLYQKGESLAFEAIYEKYQAHVYTYLQRRLTDKDIIHDIFQNIFVKFHKSKDNYDPKYPLLKWVYTICRSELLDHLKKKKVSYIEINPTHLATEPDASAESHIELAQEKSLSSTEKLALELRYYSDKDFSEISKLLNTSPANARKLISRGLGKLRLKYSGGSK
ncbi:MAG: sigma-70 family RNA polymerase sigma factor [Bdellovibrionaceae bacterium]|nr:sigma-70 family RNA polymerase sigma factor [Pseudobdellovibrionaceae bacterium]